MSNTGAVAGVFTVVGIILFGVIFVFIITFCRRWRAKKWDRELTAAAAARPQHGFEDYGDNDYHSAIGRKYGGGGYPDMQEVGINPGSAGIGIQRTATMSSWQGGLRPAVAMPYPAFAAPPEPGHYSQYPSYHSGYNLDRHQQPLPQDHASSPPSGPPTPGSVILFQNSHLGTTSPDTTNTTDTPLLSPRHSQLLQDPLPTESYAAYYVTRGGASVSPHIPDPFGEGDDSVNEHVVPGGGEKVLRVANQ